MKRITRYSARTIVWKTNPLAGLISPRVGMPFALTAIYLFWGTAYLAIDSTIRHFPPLLMMGARFFIAGCVLFPFLKYNLQLREERIEIKSCFILGAFFILANSGVAVAQKWISPSQAALFVGIVPVWTTLLLTFKGERASFSQILGIVLGITGLCILTTSELGDFSIRGSIVMLSCTLLWAYGTVLSRETKFSNPIRASSTQMIFGGSIVILLGIMNGDLNEFSFEWTAVWGLLYLIFGGSLIAFSAYQYLLKNAHSNAAVSYTYVCPAIAVLLDWTIGTSHITFLSGMAVIFICVSAILMIRREKPRIIPSATYYKAA